MKAKNFLLAALAAVVLAGCEPKDEIEGESLPKIADRVLGMEIQNACEYLLAQGFVYEGDEQHKKHWQEFIFSKDPDISQFSFESKQVIWLTVQYTTSVRSVEATQRMNNKEGRELYWSWSHYTASKETKYPNWYGVIEILGEQWQMYEDRAPFWSAYQEAGSRLSHASENYVTETNVERPREIYLSITWSDNGYALNYTTLNYISEPQP